MADPPILRSKYQEFIDEVEAAERLAAEGLGKRGSTVSSSILIEEHQRRRESRVAMESEEEEDNNSRKSEEQFYFHCWVYVHIPEAAFFIEATTGS